MRVKKPNYKRTKSIFSLVERHIYVLTLNIIQAPNWNYSFFLFNLYAPLVNGTFLCFMCMLANVWLTKAGWRKPIPFSIWTSSISYTGYCGVSIHSIPSNTSESSYCSIAVTGICVRLQDSRIANSTTWRRREGRASDGCIEKTLIIILTE